MKDFDKKVINYEEIRSANKLKKRRNLLILKWIYTFLILIILIGFLANILFLKIILNDSIYYIIPLMSLAYFHIFYNSRTKFSNIERIILIVVIISYVLFIVLFEFFPKNIWIYNIFNLTILGNIYFIIKAFLEYFLTLFFPYKIIDIRNKSKKINLIYGSKSKRIKESKILNKRLLNIYRNYDYWYAYSSKRDSDKYFIECDSILSYLYEIHYLSLYYSGDSYNEFSEAFLDLNREFKVNLYLQVIYNKNDIMMSQIFISYKKRFLFLIKNRLFKEHSNEIKDFLFGFLSVLAKNSMNMYVTRGINLMCEIIIDEKEDSLNSLDYKPVKYFDDLIQFCTNYLDNLNPIDGKIIVQTIEEVYDGSYSEDEKDNLRKSLFSLIHVMLINSNSNNSIINYYVYLSIIAFKYEKLDEIEEFFISMIISLDKYEEFIAPYVFSDVSELYNTEKFDNEEIIRLFLTLQAYFSSNITHFYTDVIVDWFITSDKVDKEMIVMLAFTISKNINFGIDIFDSISNLLSEDMEHLENIKKNIDVLIDVFEYSISYSEIVEDSIKILDKISHFASNTLKALVKKEDKLVKQKIYEKFVDFYVTLTNGGNTCKFNTKAIEYIHDITVENEENEYMEVLAGALFKAGYQIIEECDYINQRKISNTIGWLAYSSISKGDKESDSSSAIFKLLVDYYDLIVEFSREDVVYFVGTAIIINYVNFLIYSKKRTYYTIESDFDILLHSDRNIPFHLLKSIRLKEFTIESYFEDKKDEALENIKKTKLLIKSVIDEQD